MLPFRNRKVVTDKARGLLQGCAKDDSMDKKDDIVDHLQVAYFSD